MDIRITCFKWTAGMFQTGVFGEVHNVAKASNMFEAPDSSDQSVYVTADQTVFSNLHSAICLLCSGLDFLALVFKLLKTFWGQSTGMKAEGVGRPAQPPWALQHHPCRLEARPRQVIRSSKTWGGEFLPQAQDLRSEPRSHTSREMPKEVLQTGTCVQAPTALKHRTLANHQRKGQNWKTLLRPRGSQLPCAVSLVVSCHLFVFWAGHGYYCMSCHDIWCRRLEDEPWWHNILWSLGSITVTPLSSSSSTFVFVQRTWGLSCYKRSSSCL